MYKALDKWLMPYLKRPLPQLPESGHFLFCICDHFEPYHDTDGQGALERMQKWREDYPKMVEDFREKTGVPLKWTFFYPVEQYDTDVVNELATICASGDAETEIHLHHENDTYENLADVLSVSKERLCEHGLLSKDELDQTRYAFIHGNWALGNSHPEGLHCGVDNEIQALIDWGCIADFTMPSAPSHCQTEIINAIYYAEGSEEPASHNDGPRVKVGQDPLENGLLMVQGPLGLNKNAKKFGFLPSLENGDLTAANPPTYERLKLWTGQGISVEGREEWVVVKLYTHGALPENTEALLGEPMRAFADDFARFMEENPNWKASFLTARQLVNVIKAAEAGEDGDPMDYVDYKYTRVPGFDSPPKLEPLQEPPPQPEYTHEPVLSMIPANPNQGQAFQRINGKLMVIPNFNSGVPLYVRKRGLR